MGVKQFNFISSDIRIRQRLATELTGQLILCGWKKIVQEVGILLIYKDLWHIRVLPKYGHIIVTNKTDSHASPRAFVIHEKTLEDVLRITKIDKDDNNGRG